MLDSAAMSRNLVVVESPAKAKTIERYLGPDYQVLASYGHVRDLPERPAKGEMGVDVAHDFTPEYEIVADRVKQVRAIEKAGATAPTIYLATDLDREGEAIAWHVAEAAHLSPERTRRVTFSEITKPAIQAAFAHPRAIDVNLVDAQQARRVVDRLVGYTLSPLLWRKVRAGLSAGRVQSVAVRLVVEREREIRAFVAIEYWTIEVLLRTTDGQAFVADLVRVDGRKPVIGNEATALAIAAELRAAHPIVTGVTRRESGRNPAPPFTTSTLQQEASRKLGFAPKRTMSAAQRLYEGVAVGGEQTGLITYMRTDSVALSAQAIREAHDVVMDRYGAAYAVPKGRHYKTKSRNAQEAHEAIRPTSFARDPDSIAGALKPDEARLYRLIWQRAIASQMAAKRLETSAIELEDGRLGLRASATRTLFDGFSRVYTEGRDDGEEEREATLPELREGDVTEVERTEAGDADVRPTQHFTEPPPRYTEATLVKALEENGIGRPSTYAATLSTIVDRGYVVVREKRLVPEAIGFIVTDLLVAHFGEFVDVDFTARMEGDLDSVASGERRWVPVVREFYTPLAALVAEKLADVRPADVGVRPEDIGLPAGLVCSEGHPMLVRAGRYGEFLACSDYPDHKESRPLPPVTGPGSGADGDDGKPLGGVGEPCPECGETAGGILVARNGRFGPFVGCARYPECTYIKKDGPPPPEQLGFEAPCPTCGKGHLKARRARRDGTVFWGCSRYPKCTYTSWREPLGPVHEPDGAPIARTDDPEAGVCLGCGATVPLPAVLPAPGTKLAGGTPDPAALVRPRAPRGASSGRRQTKTRGGGAAQRRPGTTAPGGTAGRGGRGKGRAAGGADGGEPPR
jgi:DNA topoisomerase-1